MELQLAAETVEKLGVLALRTQRGTDELLMEAVDHLVAYNDWFEGKVRASMGEAEVGRVVSNEEVAAWMERRERR